MTIRSAQICWISDMKKFDCAIFDLDGTVLDSTALWNEIDRDFFAERNLVLPVDYAKKISPMGFYGAAVYTVKTFELKESVEEVLDVWHKMAVERFTHDVGLKPFAKEYLEYLKEHNVRLCIATASNRELFEPALERNGVLGLFDSITTISEVKRGKGFPDIYLKAAQTAGRDASECVVFEDILEGIKGAKLGGFYTVCVYDKQSAKDEEKIREISDRYINDYSELM